MCRLIHPTPARSFTRPAKQETTQARGGGLPSGIVPHRPDPGPPATRRWVSKPQAPTWSGARLHVSPPSPSLTRPTLPAAFVRFHQRGGAAEQDAGATTALSGRRTAGKRWQRFSRPQRFVLRASPPPEPVSILVQRLRTNTFPSPWVRGGSPRCGARGGPWGRRRGVAGLETPPHREAWPDPAGAATAAGPAAGGGAERRGGHPGSSPSTMLAAQNTLQHNAQRVQQQGRQNRARRASGR